LGEQGQGENPTAQCDEHSSYWTLTRKKHGAVITS
jgi:hypothetical protein